MITADDNGRLILSDGGDPRAAYAGLNALSPVLMGLTLPLVAFMVAAPVTMKRAGPIIVVLLAFLFFVALVVFLVSVFYKGPVTAIAATEDGVLEVYRQGPFATGQERFDIDEIADLRIAVHYDDDGYATRIPQLLLVDGSTIELAISADEADINHFRRVLGLSFRT